MRYRRSDPGQSFEEYLKNPCISNRGFIYEQHLKEYLSNPGLSLNAIADMLDVEANTVGQYAKKNGIDNLYKKNYRIETGKIFILKYAREAAGGRFSVYKRFYD